MKVVLGVLIAVALPAVAFAHNHFGGPHGYPAPAPDLAVGLPAAVAAIAAFAATRFKRRP